MCPFSRMSTTLEKATFFQIVKHPRPQTFDTLMLQWPANDEVALIQARFRAESFTAPMKSVPV